MFWMVDIDVGINLNEPDQQWDWLGAFDFGAIRTRLDEIQGGSGT
jgi:hypothetical protein